MSIHPKWFPWANEHGVRVGSHVRHADGREGIVTLVWIGLEEAIDVILPDGTTVTWHPADGLDEVEVVA